MTRSEAIDAALAHIDRERLETRLVALVDAYSPSFSEEPAMAVIAEALHDAGLSYLRQPVPMREHAQDDGNLIVELGPSPPVVMWVGHVDTVPPADDELLVSRVVDGHLHALGAADMKGACAAALEALIAIQESGVRLERGLAVAFVVGEEEAGDGSEALAARWQAPFTIIGEPTGLAPATEHYGYFEFRLAAEGHQVHAALPEIGGSAIHAMLVWLTELCERAGRAASPEQLAVNPREIGGGGDLFVVADRCEASVDVHAAPHIGRELILEVVEAARARAADAHARCTLTHELLFDSPGYEMDDSPALAPVHRAYERVGRVYRPAAFRSHSDAPIFHAGKSTVLVAGPGALEVAHTRHESIALDEVHEAARLYTAMFLEMCS